MSARDATWAAITQQTLREWGSDKRLAGIYAQIGKESLTLAEVLDLNKVPASDRVWVACQYLARHDRDTLVSFARWCAAEADTDAADAAARAVARCAADVEYVEATKCAAQCAVYAAARAAARAAEHAAWYDSEYDANAARAKRQRQVTWLLENMKESGK